MRSIIKFLKRRELLQLINIQKGNKIALLHRHIVPIFTQTQSTGIRNFFLQAAKSIQTDIKLNLRHRNSLAKIDGELLLSYNCKICKTTNKKIISKIAYDKGVVIAQCTGCKKYHLIADHLDWFSRGEKSIENVLAKKEKTALKIKNGEYINKKDEYRL